MNRITVTELEPYPGQQWKCGDEFLPFHPQASHVPPEYRDGWNRCYWMAVAAVARATNNARPVAQPVNTSGASGSPSSYRARPSDPDLNPVSFSASASPATKEQQ